MATEVGLGVEGEAIVYWSVLYNLSCRLSGVQVEVDLSLTHMRLTAYSSHVIPDETDDQCCVSEVGH